MTSEHTLYDDLAFYINGNDKEKNKILITKNMFKQKSRKAIQNATVKRTLDILNSLI